MRIGFGYDIHRFGGRRPLRLGGVTIPHPRGLLGHSDADVLLHALADALLGAVGGPDIGELFPPGDPRYRDADSRVFVRAARERVRRAGWRVGNVDAVVIADAPKLTGHKPQIVKAISALLDVAATHVSVKAKTTEGFDPGRLGIAAHVAVLIRRDARRRA